MREWYCFADGCVEAELYAHAFKDLAASVHDAFFQFERRNAEHQQPADFGVFVIDNNLNAVAREDIGARETGGTGADNGGAFAGGNHFGEVGTPAFLKCNIGNVFFNRADGDGAKAVV